MTSLAVFDTPSPPDGWEGREVIRIVDPLGKGAAWIDPMFAGICVGFFVRNRQTDPWQTALTSSPPRDIGQWGAVGCELLWFAPDNDQPVPVREMGSGWTFETRDPTSVTVTGVIDQQRIEVTYRCDDGVLMIDAHLSPNDPVEAAFGLRLHMGAAEAMEENIGQVSLVGDPLPAGELRCLSRTTMNVRWERARNPTSKTRVDWVPRPVGQGGGGRNPSYGWSVEAGFE